ncbi:MAG TPA: hypothetical protein VGP45_03380, partial [Marinobacter sp.]|nr:hypothetical protein [Marinobacter sp.]
MMMKRIAILDSWGLACKQAGGRKSLPPAVFQSNGLIRRQNPRGRPVLQRHCDCQQFSAVT